MKKSLVFFEVLFLIILAMVQSASAYDIAYVVKTSSNSIITSALDELGYTYNTITDSQVPSTNFSDYSVILVQDNIVNKNSLPLNKDVLFFDKYLAPIVWPGVSVSSSNTFSSNFEELGTAFTQGFSDIKFNAYTSTKPIFYLKIKPSYVKRVALTTGASGYYGIVTYSDSNGLRRVFFGFIDISYWTSDTKKLFKNSIKWLVLGEDRDRDGYYSDVDCNDLNPNIWQKLKGYSDNDNDNYGAGSSLEVCSGNSLPKGYSEVNGDCNDQNRDINPDGIEIPYDGIDQNCDGYDLVDVDNDGYSYLLDCNDNNQNLWQNIRAYTDNDNDGYGAGNSMDICSGNSLPKGYSIFDGDCNDNDPSFNPDSEDAHKNCLNDAPVIDYISKIIIRETEEAVVIINAIDPENDALVYSINDSRFVKDFVEKNKFAWQTNYNDEGLYKFNAIASDGNLNTNMEFEVEITGTNRAPVCVIPELSWNEDEIKILVFKDYCSDPDGDSLIFSIKQQTENSHISISIDNNAEFFPELDWFGEEWVIFKVSDGLKESESNKINLKVVPVNDAPVLKKNIGSITLNEDTNLTKAINLNDYFSDIDNFNLYFEVRGNNFVDIKIINGFASFYPKKDWFGEEKVIFSASDMNYKADSNEVLLKVTDMNEPPVFREINCEKNIMEDREYNCKLSATDFENETFVFRIVNQNNLNCSIDGDNLKYMSYADYNGNASCVLRVTDSSNGYSEFLFEVKIQNINDPPLIKNPNPQENNIKILKGATRLFSVSAYDIDSLISDTKWFIDGENVGNESSYLFNRASGNYTLNVSISDGEFSDSHFWNIFVRDLMYFKCSEVNGYACAENQACSQEFLGVYDTDRCCPVSCTKKPPQFSAITKPESNKTDLIAINIKEPVRTTELELNDKINILLDLENRFSEEMDMEVKVYLYDTTRERIVEKTKSFFRLDKNLKKSLNYELNTDYEMNENYEYAIYVLAEAESKNNKYHNSDYNEITLKRKEHDIIIEKIEISPADLLCGDSFKARVYLKNIGKIDEFITLKIKNKELSINEEAINQIKIENYWENNDKEEVFDINIPSNSKAGTYKLKISAVFDDETAEYEKEIALGECKSPVAEVEPLKILKVENKENIPLTLIIEDKKKIMFLVLNIFSLAWLFFLLVVTRIYKNKIQSRKKLSKNIRRKA